MLADPDHMWEPAEIIDWTKTNLPPLFAPDNGFHYSDTNFVLVGWGSCA